MISSGPILGTLAEVATDGKVDLAGVVDRTQVLEVLRQWHLNGNAAWKEPLLRTALTRAPFSGKHSTPVLRPARCTTTCTPRSRSPTTSSSSGASTSPTPGELNAENVLEIADAGLADLLAGFVDGIRARYPGIDV